MIVDASAVIAVLEGEPRQASIVARMEEAESLAIPAPTALEAILVMVSRRGEPGISKVIEFLIRTGTEIVEFDRELLDQAALAFFRFGKGRHPAGLNYGDCMVYALAKAKKMPILCTGDDFAKTNIAIA